MHVKGEWSKMQLQTVMADDYCLSHAQVGKYTKQLCVPGLNGSRDRCKITRASPAESIDRLHYCNAGLSVIDSFTTVVELIEELGYSINLTLLYFNHSPFRDLIVLNCL